MLKKVLASLIFISLIGFGIYQIFSSNSDSLQELKCDLNMQNCKYKFNKKEVLISFEPKPIKSLELVNLNIENLGTYENLKLKIYGLSMDMGELKPKIYKLNENTYESKVFLSACVLENMRFRAELFDGEKPLGFHFDFELRQ